MTTLKIDPEFRDKIPPLTSAEFEQLKENILSAGEVYEPICVWNGTIVDGHNRWRIIQEHPEIPFKVKEMGFADKWEAFDWMYANQLGRRNLTDEQKTYILGKLYEVRKQRYGGDRKSSLQNEDLKPGGRTVAIVAREQGVGKSTVERAEHFVKGIDKAAEVDPDFKRDVLSGVVKAKKSDLAAIRKLESPDEIQEAVDAIRSGRTAPKPRPQSKEMKEFTDKINSVVKAMEDDNREYTIDDAITDFGSAEDTFFMQVRFIIQERQSVINTERGKEELIYFIDTMIKELNELKKEVE